jgi:hypothetical protein
VTYQICAFQGANVVVGGSAPISGLINALGQASSVMINTMHADCIALPSVSIVKGKDTTVIIGADDRCMLILVLLPSIPIPCLHPRKSSWRTTYDHFLPPVLSMPLWRRAFSTELTTTCSRLWECQLCGVVSSELQVPLQWSQQWLSTARVQRLLTLRI